MIDAVLSALKSIRNIVNKTFYFLFHKNYHPTLMKLSRGQCCHITEYLLARAGTKNDLKNTKDWFSKKQKLLLFTNKAFCKPNITETILGDFITYYYLLLEIKLFIDNIKNIPTPPVLWKRFIILTPSVDLSNLM